jgi:ABC-type glutathione transport system ATPase component
LDIEKGIKEAEEEQGFDFSLEQKNIIKEAVKHNIVGISGKAGSGKTTISRALLKIYKNANKMIGGVNWSYGLNITSLASIPTEITLTAP